MLIWLTQWALDSYLDFKHKGVISHNDYKNILRPDVLLLGNYSASNASPKFRQSSFWGPMDDGRGGYVFGVNKMKWHNFGTGKIELRLCVMLSGGAVFLCEAHSKTGTSDSKRAAIRAKHHHDLIYKGMETRRGVIK